MTAFAGVPCGRCGELRDSDGHKPLEECPNVLAGRECLEPGLHHEYRPDEGSLEFAAVELAAALDQCAKWAGRPCHNARLAHLLEGRKSLREALEMSRKALALAESLGITTHSSAREVVAAEQVPAQESEPTGLAAGTRGAPPPASPSLMPCPFCGGIAGHRKIPAAQGAPAIYGASCDDCEHCGPWFGLQAKAAAAWNRRELAAAAPVALEPGSPEHEAAVLRDGLEGRR